MIKTENLYNELCIALENYYLSKYEIEKLSKVEFNNFKITRIEGNIININKHIFINVSKEKIEIFNTQDSMDWYLDLEIKDYENIIELSFDFIKMLEYALKHGDYWKELK